MRPARKAPGGSPPASGEPPDWDKIAPAPCPDLASPRPPIPPPVPFGRVRRTGPLPRSTNPRHYSRPSGLFPRILQHLIESPEKGTKGRRLGPPRTAKCALFGEAGRAHSPGRVIITRKTGAGLSASAPSHGKSLIRRGFMTKPKRGAISAAPAALGKA